MEPKSIQIITPEGYEIDKEKSTFEKIVFKPIDSRPRSWEEYCKQQKANNKKGYYINSAGCNLDKTSWNTCSTTDFWRNVLPSEELAKAFLAMMQLMSLRQAWIGDWKPDWDNAYLRKYCIEGEENGNFRIDALCLMRSPLSFPTKQMAEEFLDCFKDLIEQAKLLI